MCLGCKPVEQTQPSSPTSHAPLPSTTDNHICTECYSYKHRKILRNFFVFDQQDVHLEDMGKPAFEWEWESSNQQRKITVSVSAQRSILGYAPAQSMPYVITEGVVVNGVQLQGQLRQAWERFVVGNTHRSHSVVC